MVTNNWRVVIGLTCCLLTAPGATWGAVAFDRSMAPVHLSSAGRARRPLLGTDELDRLRDVLAGTDQTAILAAIQALGDGGAGNAAPLLVEVLAVGAPVPVTVAAIDALKKLRDPTSVEVLALYAGNRGPEIRRHAVEALGIFADGRVVPVLMDRLGDAVVEVRGAAAQALATRGEKTATPRMLALLRRNDAAVAGPLGALAPISLLSEISELRGGIADDNLATTLGELLKRRDVPESGRMEIVKALSGIPGPAATTALIEYVGMLPPQDRRASRSEAQRSVDERAKQP